MKTWLTAVGAIAVALLAGCGGGKPSSSSTLSRFDHRRPGEQPISAVYTWGGNGGKISKSPVKVGGLPASIVAVQAANWGSLALDESGHVWSWNASSTPRATEVDGPMDVVSIGEGGSRDSFGAAVTSSGALWTWGHDENGQLCDGQTTSGVESPARVSGVSDAVQVSGASGELAFLTSAGTVWSCGGNEDGQLGDGSTKRSDAPVEVKGLDKIVAISAGDTFTLALDSSGHVWAWGLDNFGQLGDGETTNSDVPVGVRLPSAAKEVFAGGGRTSSNGQSLALLTNGQVWGWGNDAWGQLGNGETEHYSDVPIEATALPSDTWNYVATGGSSSFALDTSGNLYAWGDDTSGQLGDGKSRRDVLDPEKVATGYTLISAVAEVFVGG